MRVETDIGPDTLTARTRLRSNAANVRIKTARTDPMAKTIMEGWPIYARVAMIAAPRVPMANDNITSMNRSCQEPIASLLDCQIDEIMEAPKTATQANPVPDWIELNPILKLVRIRKYFRSEQTRLAALNTRSNANEIHVLRSANEIKMRNP
jgi:hypothetical protein